MGYINLLGNSQTFIGVLATIVILCVVTGAQSSNFLYNILEGYAKPTRENIKRLKEELTTRVTSLKEAIPHINFIAFINKINSDRELSDSIKDISNQYRVLYTIYISEFNSRYNNTYLVHREKRCNDICEAKEQTFAPIFVFAYCILVFMFDEIVSWFPYTLPYILSMLAVFTLLSTFFLIGIWLKFYFEFCQIKIEGNERNVSIAPIRIFWTRKAIKTFCNIIVSALLFVGCLYVIDNYVYHIPLLITRSLIGVILVIPFCLYGLKHLKSRLSYGNYSHSFLLWHFLSIFVLSIGYTILLFLPLDYLTSAHIPYSDKQWEIQGAIIVFILIFGIILPFAVPYLCYKKIHKDSVDDYNKSCSQMAAESREIESEINNYIRDIKALIEFEDLFDYEKIAGLDCCFESMKL